jgi:hypothetical protein
LGYFFLRMSVENVERRASVSAVYNILAVLTVPLSYVSFIIWPSLHPRLSEGGGLGLTGTMVQALLMNMFSGLLFMGWLIRKVLALTWVSLLGTALWLRKRGADIERSLEEIES